VALVLFQAKNKRIESLESDNFNASKDTEDEEAYTIDSDVRHVLFLTYRTVCFFLLWPEHGMSLQLPLAKDSVK